MPGTWTITRATPTPIHSFTAPEEGWLVNSHIIEFSTQLFGNDAQYTLPFAREVNRYAATLGKPLTRLYVTHYHPDHLLGAAVFGCAAVCARKRGRQDRQCWRPRRA
jgi:glyoxylase-like metal-dependent hydrolase (beta-lactamase superfamily II)